MNNGDINTTAFNVGENYETHYSRKNTEKSYRNMTALYKLPDTSGKVRG